eukprot:TRINITY_DN19755_c0_g1_i1.p1 TRINITY_DN19755_c0_g1~~TRINITY_DN19755_c0_g1_i1.p1  ORF type:complete len:380 (+),score=86.45 TRINITY_DN19755_c0_g1_i1:42-1142(+)
MKILLGIVLMMSGSSGAAAPEGMVYFKGGRVRVGTDDTKFNKNMDGEGPEREAKIKPFYLDETPVTNSDFKQFTKETKYKTEAEHFGWSFVLSSLASESVRNDERTESLPDAKHWLAVPNAYWRAPEGKGTGIKSRLNHPAVHISLSDAAAYCKWARKRLPYETEWEHAANGKKQPKANLWQGEFPDGNTEKDGFHGTSPVQHYAANGKGMFAMVGNVWEWTATVFSKGNEEKKEMPKYVLKGGSFVDSSDGKTNHKARPSTRMGNTPDSGSHNTGFRCAANGPEGDPIADKPRGQGGRAGMDQDLLQDILASDGVEGLQQYMRDIGMDGSVMTPKQMKEQQEAIQKEKERMERQMRGEEEEDEDY